MGKANVRLNSLSRLFLWFFLVSLVTSQTCSKSNPCEKGCCNKNKYCGYGPDYCAPEVCVDGCQAKSDCRSTGWPGGYSLFDDCPLNVCCSKFGFCGTTPVFCGASKVQQPQCDAKATSPMARVVGYYESWGPRRQCDQFQPESTPVGVYTHINFAFATIDPNTYQIRPGHMDDVSLYKKVAQLKGSDPELKVFIAIGGWTFNDPGPTRTVFSDIAASYVKQRDFIKSLIAFLSAFDFDGILNLFRECVHRLIKNLGVDLDWEYPSADDRGGRPEDSKNFPKFIANLKEALVSAGKPGLSIT
jgi:chitinase